MDIKSGKGPSSRLGNLIESRSAYNESVMRLKTKTIKILNINSSI